MSDALQRIDQVVKSNRVVLFMKGSPNFPVRIFGSRGAGAARLWRRRLSHGRCARGSTDIRQGIKQYANWPTIPQLYVDGEFVGGSDIVTEMYESGELQQVLEAH